MATLGRGGWLFNPGVSDKPTNISSYPKYVIFWFPQNSSGQLYFLAAWCAASYDKGPARLVRGPVLPCRRPTAPRNQIRRMKVTNEIQMPIPDSQFLTSLKLKRPRLATTLSVCRHSPAIVHTGVATSTSLLHTTIIIQTLMVRTEGWLGWLLFVKNAMCKER